jgi:3-hydroxyisobutyrate dehydrogenase-like beta-hydroxyacid dehydrogenase/nicotinamidase-related amidase
VSRLAIHTIGLIGVGRMGLGLGRNLVRRGFVVRAFDRSEDALREVVALGADAAASVADAVRGVDAVITCLPDIAAVRSVYLAADGVIAAAGAGCLLIDMTSGDPILTREIAAAAQAIGLGMVDAPMLRGAPQAWDGTVHVLAGGSAADKARAWPVLSAVSERVSDVGAIGSAHALKSVNNAVTMANNAVLAEAMMAGGRLGFTPGQLLEVFAGGLSTRLLDLYAPRFLSGDHPPTAFMAIGAKDLGIFLRAAGEVGAPTPLMEAAHGIYASVCAGGAGNEPPSRLAALLEAAAGPCAPRHTEIAAPRCSPMRPLTLDPATTALVLIDLQNGIVAMPLAPRTGAEVVDRAAALATALRQAGALVVLVRVATSPDGGDALRPATDLPPPASVARAADWAELVPSIRRPASDIVITKRQWGAFHGTELDLQLRRRGIRTIVLAGIATNIGVESTARAAFEHGYDQVFVEDAMAAPSAEAHALVLRTIFPRIGKLRTADEVIPALPVAAAKETAMA